MPVFLFGILFFIPVRSASQTIDTLTNDDSFEIKNYGVLPDLGYSVEKLENDPHLVFKQGPLRASVSNFYWVRLSIYNPYPNTENYRLSLSEGLNFSLYHYEATGKKWIGIAGGMNVTTQQRRSRDVTCVMHKAAENVFYLRIDLRDIKRYSNYAGRPAIIMEKEVTFAAREKFVTLSYLICCIVLISFSGYNLYIYFQLKDKAYLYYVIVQIGALIYFTAIKDFFNVLLPLRIYNVKLMPNGTVNDFDINKFFEHAGVTIIFCGFIQFTRVYLRTKDVLPVNDKVLRALSYGYIVLEAIPVLLTISGIFYIEVIPELNAYILIIITACIATGIMAHKRKVRAAIHFLAANLLPVLFTACTSVYILMYGTGTQLLPEIAILSQILTFGVALVARVKMISDELKAKEIEAIQLEGEKTVAEYERLLADQENRNITLTMELERQKNELLQQKLEANQRELVGNSLYIHQKNKLLADLKVQMQGMDTLYPNVTPEALKNIRSSLKGGEYLDEEWDKFKLHFEQVHPSFFADLQAAHPGLTKYELRLYAYFHINLSTKEIATMLNIAPASVRQAKARLHKKMSL